MTLMPVKCHYKTNNYDDFLKVRRQNLTSDSNYSPKKTAKLT